MFAVKGVVLLSLDFCSSEQIDSHFNNWNRDLFRHDVSCCIFPITDWENTMSLSSYYLQIMGFFPSSFASFCSSHFWLPVEDTVDIKIIHGPCSWFFDRSSLFHLFVTKILSPVLLKALFSLRTTQESKELDTRNLLLPQGGQIH